METAAPYSASTAADPGGLDWHPWITSERNWDAVRGDDRLSVAADTRGTWTWRVDRPLCAHGYEVVAQASGEAESRPDAQRAAAAHRFETVELHYDHPSGPLSLWVGGADCHGLWVACIAGECAKVRPTQWPTEPGREWRWTRDCATAAPIFALCGSNLEGYAESRQAAMIAAIEAPEQLRRAAAQFLAELRAARDVL